MGWTMGEDSILISMLQRLGGYTEGDDDFYEDIMMFTNAAISVLTQLGVGPSDGFVVTGDSETWNDFLSNPKPDRLQMVKEFVYLYVRTSWDPPTIGGVLSAYKERLDELTWRINVAVDPGEEG